ncbi:hypothetical protein AGLY_010904 [Aphis glycines]|uniref:Uncharacterized protein n=1 Tax=Aphis glycines TaxID=307491 RepID=A0A6G0TFA2_APHGL|nr:hypothetical protein AGLY_010904 [Aphis glycines]
MISSHFPSLVNDDGISSGFLICQNLSIIDSMEVVNKEVTKDRSGAEKNPLINRTDNNPSKNEFIFKNIIQFHREQKWTVDTVEYSGTEQFFSNASTRTEIIDDVRSTCIQLYNLLDDIKNGNVRLQNQNEYHITKSGRVGTVLLYIRGWGGPRTRVAKLMKNLVLNFQLLATYTNIFMNYTYKIICKYS